MKFLNLLLWIWVHYGTRILGGVTGTITVLLTQDVIPPSHVKYYLAAIAVLTYWRGQGNADSIAQKVVDKQTAALIPDPQSQEKLK
jgi:hypothetical protein